MEAKEVQKFVLTQEQINEIATISGKEALRAFREEQRREERKRIRENDKVKQTKKMLGSYRRLKAKLSEEVEFTEEEQIELRWKFLQDLMGNVKDTMSQSERVIKDTEKCRQEDLYCIYRLEKAIEMYQNECEKSGNEEMQRRYRELSMMYLQEKQYTIQEIARLENISDKTIYRDLGIACGIVAVYLFGV